MHILILGAAGMVGRKLTERLLRDGHLGKREITRMTLQDVVAPAKARQRTHSDQHRGTSDFADAGTAAPLIAHRPEVIFHLAAIVSGEAEAEFDKGYRINLDGTRHLIDAIRAVGGGYKPRLVFTSSIAVFGAPFPDKIGDEFFHTPLTSYGTQKSICELLINDYTRKGLLDGISIRLPTICVRPGKPNKAASGFFSNIMREPLAGEEAVLPVSDDVRHWHASPKSAVGLSAPRRHHGPHGDGRTAQSQHARAVGDRRRADRSAGSRGGQERHRADQAGGRSDHHRHRQRLAARFRHRPRAQARLHHGRKDL